MLLYGVPSDTEERFAERVVETVLGVALAVVFVWLIPWLRDRRRSGAAVSAR